MKANLIITGVAGLFLGLTLGVLLFRAPGDPAPAPDQEVGLLRARVADLQAELDDRAPPESPPAGPPGAPDAVKPAPEPESLVDATPEALESRVQELARRFREQGERTIETAEAGARAVVARELAAERAQREDLARGGTMAWLRSLEKDWNPPWELTTESERFEALFVRKTAGQTLDGRSINRDSRLADGDRIVYPAGSFALDLSGLNQQEPFPEDVLIQGNGMDQTLVRLSDEIRFKGDIHSLTLEDLTVHCGDQNLESIRGGPYTLRVRRCRIVGFDNGAGGSPMLGGSVGAFYASDSKIEAGFGRSPGFGNLFDVRGALVVRLENCDIVGPFRSIYYQWSGAAHVFANCRFSNLTRSNRSQIERDSAEVRFVGCTFTYQSEDAPTHPRERRKLEELNPDW